MTTLPKYRYNGARALVLLHDLHLRSFFETWKQAKEFGVKLPETSDTDYASIEALLLHVLRSSRGYILWICEKLKLVLPDIDPPPVVDKIVENSESYLEHVLNGWKLPLTDVEEALFFTDVFTSNWGTGYCIEAMLEHAVMHPIRHEFQLRRLIEAQGPDK